MKLTARRAGSFCVPGFPISARRWLHSLIKGSFVVALLERCRYFLFYAHFLYIFLRSGKASIMFALRMHPASRTLSWTIFCWTQLLNWTHRSNVKVKKQIGVSIIMSRRLSFVLSNTLQPNGQLLLLITRLLLTSV